MMGRVLSTDQLKLLVERARGADPDAWEALYRHAYPQLHSYARRRLAGDDQADDAVSEAMTRAIDRLDSFTWSGAGFDGWLFGILRNVVLETYRRGARHPVADVSALPEPVAVDADPSVPLVAREDASEVVAAFNQLSSEVQELLELRVVAQLDARSVGDILGRRAGSVRMAQSRALGRLRNLMMSDAP